MQARAERAAGDEEVLAVPHGTAGPPAQHDEPKRVGDEQGASRVTRRGRSANVAGGRKAGQRRARRARRARSHRSRLRPPARRWCPTFGSPARSPVASTNSVSPSDGVCDGTIARAMPSCAICATFSACALVSRALVAITPIVVASRARALLEHAAPHERERILEAACRRPCARRRSALPVRGSTTDPTAFTATIAPTIRPSVVDERGRCRCRLSSRDPRPSSCRPSRPRRRRRCLRQSSPGFAAAAAW